MNYKDIYFYDVESFPTFACLTFMKDNGKNTDGDVFQFKFGCGYNDLKMLEEFVDRRILLVGFNSISYDNAVLRFILAQNNGRNITKKVFELSKRLVNDESRKDDDIKALRYPRDKQDMWDFLDLFKIMHFDRLGVGLKQVAINLKHDRIQDLPYPYDYPISHQSEVDVVLDYNVNDVIITRKLFYNIQPQIQLRKDIGELYNVNVMNASDSKMGNIILEHYYQEEYGIDLRKIRDLRTQRASVNLSECIPSVISFNTPELQRLHKQISEMTVFAFDKFKFDAKINFRGTHYSIGVGGIHSDEPAHKFTSTDTVKILSCDIASMYPTNIIINNIYPEHLDETFVQVLSTVTAERLAAKKTNTVKAEALKITVNGLFGKLNSSTFWLEDAKAMLKVTVSGQLYILMLVEALELKGIHCISANTDGIECLVNVDQLQLYYNTCKQWERLTQFQLEYTEYKSYVTRDINNYIAITTGNKVKTKGVFVPEIDLKKGYVHPIVAKAVYAYYVHGTDVQKTIEECTDIFEFAISKKSSKEWKMQMRTVNGVKDLQKTNRFYIARYGGYLQKLNIEDGRVIGLYVKRAVQLLNEYDSEKAFETYNVGIDWYVREAKSMIEEIEPSAVQVGMFALDVPMDAVKLNMFGEDITFKKKKARLPEQITIEEVGVAFQKKLTYDVDFRYALVIETDVRYSPRVKLYSLAKGTQNTFKIKKDIFANQPLKAGDVVYLDGFEKRPKYIKQGDTFVEKEGEFEWWITTFDIKTDVSNFRRKEQ